MNRYPRAWQGTTQQSNVRFKCGYCGTDTSPSYGWNTDDVHSFKGHVLICTSCNRPSFIEMHEHKITETTPASVMGNEVNGLPEDIEALYNEARQCTSIGSYTAAVLTCRKILMHVAVEKGADEGNNFLFYVNYLSDNNYIPPDGKEWVDHIREKSNEANHEITIMDIDEADDLISFTEMLLRLVYEFKHRLRKPDDENMISE
ncbi:MAG: DUF4145 domain-containing protein [Calditrichaeota bacterium]|nr:MAG: DUF4145 domain-containing protein [Calditrichota bacterium]MBL1207474.1 DUF4145 domain-containing protein [Calditrichota bacterium]NOG47306.1 DUF4145 domain-containing protein [Calditrichota bacterium]